VECPVKAVFRRNAALLPLAEYFPPPHPGIGAVFAIGGLSPNSASINVQSLLVISEWVKEAADFAQKQGEAGFQDALSLFKRSTIYCISASAKPRKVNQGTIFAAKRSQPR
jgi:hypothetical protein